jgi:hypothetical protein
MLLHICKVTLIHVSRLSLYKYHAATDEEQKTYFTRLLILAVLHGKVNVT